MEERQSDKVNQSSDNRPASGAQPGLTPPANGQRTEAATDTGETRTDRPQGERTGRNNRNNRNRNRRDRKSGGRSPDNGNQRDGLERPAENDLMDNDPIDQDISNRPDDRADRDYPRDDRNRRADRPSDSRPDRNRSRDRPLDTRSEDDRTSQVTAEPDRTNRPLIGISLGDYNGIGPEVILKALKNNQLHRICTPVVYGSMRILNRYRNLLDLKDWTLNGVQDVGQINPKLTNVITCWADQNEDILPGQVTPEAGQAALACLQRAVDDLKAGKLDAIVTAPINKSNIQSETFKFPGHTEYLAEQFGVQDNLMFLVSDLLRVGVVTGHVPLGRVRQNITRERIAQKLTLMMQSLKQDFGIEKPKIAVLGLNPHAGEEGLIGNEEQDIVKPLLADWQKKGHLIFGPYPADGFFGTRSYLKFDAVLAMYHDQGLIPFKAIAFEEGVNFTAGMPAVRTSPDHGTAYDIAGKNLADETSMLQAIYTAIDVARTRKEHLELEAGALK